MLDNDKLSSIVAIGIELTAEKSEHVLRDKILSTAIEATNCDGGALYLYQKDKLVFKILKTRSRNISLGGDGAPVDMPSVPIAEDFVTGYAAIHKSIINVDDIYQNKLYDFYGVKRYDAMTGYRTKSMLVVPMVNKEGDVVGVIELMNAMDDKGDIISFGEDAVYAARTIASQAAVSVSNVIYVKEIKKQMHSFVEAFTTVIDARTPYNATHTQKLTAYAEKVADEINRLHEEGQTTEYFDDNRKEQLLLAASLHDIGKMAIPLAVMNKATRLENGIDEIKKRFTLIEAYFEIDQLKNVISLNEFKLERDYLRESFALIEKVNMEDSVTDAQLDEIRKIAHHNYYRGGEVIPYLTDYELECLCIRRGTLTDSERTLMESHVDYTNKILKKVHFNQNYNNVARFATSHHELLDGSGYPKHLKGASLELESRILAAVDIYDALTSEDRPYKKPIPKAKAFQVLDEMVDEGKLDEMVIGYMKNVL